MPTYVFHKTHLTDPVELKPRYFVRNSLDFGVLSNAFGVGGSRALAPAAASLAEKANNASKSQGKGPSIGLVGKLLTEFVTEEVRKREFSDAVSRLDCVFGFLDPIDAFESLSVWSPQEGDKTVWICEVPNEVAVSRTNLDKFYLPAPPPQAKIPDPGWWRNAIDEIEDRASSYWVPGPLPTGEALIGGAVRMIRRVHLREFLTYHARAANP